MQNKELCLNVTNNKALINLCGPTDEHLRAIAKHFHVKIYRHGDSFQIKGDDCDAAANTIKQLFALAENKHLDLQSVEKFLNNDNKSTETAHNNQQISAKNIKGKTPNQERYLAAILNNDITFGIGPAGTGKTYLAVACAVRLFEEGKVNRMVLVRPAVEAGEKLGFLPGDLVQKVDPYLRPIYDALYSMMGVEKVGKLLEKNLIEIAPLAFMRGRTLDNAFVILDEAQNTTPEQMKMFLTRMGYGSKMVITGDITQIDLGKDQPSGLVIVQKILNNIAGICFHFFDKSDVVRHPIVQKIVDAYETSNSHS